MINTLCYTLVALSTLFTVAALGYETVPSPPGTESEPVINQCPALTQEQHCSAEGRQGTDYCDD